METDILTNGPKVLSDNTFPVVGIGASAGGLDAFKRLIRAIPEDSGMAYVLVQHMDPTHGSIFPELLQKVTNIPVVEITDDIRVLPDHIYIIPGNKLLVANDGVLQLSPRPDKGKGGPHLPIDLFLTSLAEVHQAHSIGVVLSGTASDGTAGLKAIREHGGITFAQDGASAAFEGMPQSAADTGVVDFILPPEDIPQKLSEVKQFVIRSDEELKRLLLEDEASFKQILFLLHMRTGTDFTYYKQTTIDRRILRRMAFSKSKTLDAYLKYLHENTAEQDALYHDLLIPVSSFFRDQKVFENLCESVFPLILNGKASGDPIRIWVAGCSTGQEAYSMAMCLKEHIGDSDKKVQIFATDISAPAIAKARKGIYTKSDIAAIQARRLDAFFTKTGNDYLINKAVREMCVFAMHNFLKDPPFGKIDLVSCRNVLIYMEPYLQKKAFTTFHYALVPKGYLLLGKSETTASIPDLFAVAGKNDKLFTRKDMPGKSMHVATPRSEISLHDLNAVSKHLHTDFQKIADDILLNQYTPAGVVVNEAMEIVHFRGNTADYLEQAPGKPTHNLLSMAKSGLAFELRSIILKAKKTAATVIKEAIPAELAGAQHYVTIEAIPLPNAIEPHYLILFHETRNASLRVPNIAGDNEKDLRIQQLEKELAQSREDMSSIAQEQEAFNEELQTANEELMSTSEELQSLNEELEASKEELQSSIEELASLNEQTSAAQHFAEGVIKTVHQPLIVLDRALRVKTANDAFYQTFGVAKQQTEGVLIYELGNSQWNVPALKTLLEELLPQKKEITDFEVKHNFPSIGERIMQLNAMEMITEEADEKLILLAIEDITGQKLHQLKEQELFSKFQHMVLKAPVAICILKGKDYTIDLANDFYLRIVGNEKRLTGKTLFESLPGLRAEGTKQLLDNAVKNGIPLFGYEVLLDLERNNKTDVCYFNFVYQPMPAQEGAEQEVILVATEVTDQIIARKRMEAQTVMVQNMVMTAPGFVCTLKGPNHVYDLVNDRYQQLFGKRKLTGRPMLEALPELKGQEFDTRLNEVYRSGKPYVGITSPAAVARDEHLAPELRYFNFSYQPMFDDNGQVYAILVVGYEVTAEVNARNKMMELQQRHSAELEEKVQQRTLELSKSNELLVQKNEELIKLNKELELFTYVSGHDLQEPLRKIQTFSTLIFRKDYEALSDSGKDNFQRMENAMKRMQTILQDLLAYARISINTEAHENVNLGVIAAEVREELSASVLEKNAVVEIGNLGKAAINVPQFRQVFHQLLDNALKFSRPGEAPHITVKGCADKGLKLQADSPDLFSDRLLPEKDYCRITVTDNGIGFDPRYKEKIFDVFQRLHGKEDYSGTGMGLAIVKKIIENHAGIITATGRINAGATFDIYIPVS